MEPISIAITLILGHNWTVRWTKHWSQETGRWRWFDRWAGRNRW